MEITVKLGGETSKLYEGMTAQVTFITKETETVVYVSNRAVSRENGKSYVKKKEADGSITRQEIITGFCGWRKRGNQGRAFRRRYGTD